MYVLVHHTVLDPAAFWGKAQTTIPNIPPMLKLHQTLAATDGTRATCLWEAASIDAVRDFLEPALGAVSSNEYREAANRDGIAVPPSFASAATPQMA